MCVPLCINPTQGLYIYLVNVNKIFHTKHEQLVLRTHRCVRR